MNTISFDDFLDFIKGGDALFFDLEPFNYKVVTKPGGERVLMVGSVVFSIADNTKVLRNGTHWFTMKDTNGFTRTLGSLVLRPLP